MSENNKLTENICYEFSMLWKTEEISHEMKQERKDRKHTLVYRD